MLKNNSEKIIIYLIKGLVMAVLFLPLFLHSHYFFPFIVPKNVGFRILTEVALALYLVLITINPRYRPKWDKITISITVFFVITVISSLLGESLTTSFWGNYERMSGLFHMFHLFAYFLILANVFRNKKDWYQFFAFTIFIALISTVLALSQAWQIPQLIRSSGGERLTGPVGNAAFFAGYLLLHLFITIYFLLKKGRFPDKFFSYAIAGFNIYLIVFEFYRRLFLDKDGFLPVIFSNWQLLAILIVVDLIAVYLWLKSTYDFVKNVPNKYLNYILECLPQMILAAIFTYVIYETQTRGSLLSLWVSLPILFTFGYYLTAEKKLRSFTSLITFGLFPKSKKKWQVLFVVLILATLASQPILYLAKDSAFVKANGSLSRMSGFVSIIAFYFSLLAIVLVGLFFEKVKKYKIILGTILILLVVSPIFLLSARDASWVKSVPVLNTFANISSSKIITVESRLLTWEASWNGMLDRPIFGWGIENFDIVFNKYFPAEIFKDEGSRVWFDRAHNVIFDVGVTTGFVGLISYLAIFGVIVKSLLDKYKKDRQFDASLFLIVLIFANFLQNLFVFDTVNTEVVIYLIFAFIVFITSQDKPEQTEVFEQIKSKPVNLYIMILIFIPLAILIYGVNIRTLKANHLVFLAVLNQEQNSNLIYDKQLVENFVNATQIIPVGRLETRQQFSMYAQRLIKNKNISRVDASDVADIAVAELEKSVAQRPTDIRQILLLSNLYNASVEFDSSRIDKAISLVENSIELAPTRPPVYFELGQSYLFKRNLEKAVEYFKKGVEVAPWVIDSHTTLAQVYILDKQFEKANEEIAFIKNQVYSKDPNKNFEGMMESLGNSYLNIIDRFALMKEYGRAIVLLEELIENFPDKIEYRTQLASLYAEKGDVAKAEEVALKIIEIQPGARLDVETFIDSLNSND